MRRLIFILLVLLWSAQAADVMAAVRVSEVMANEPGSATSLEWIELHNDGSAAVSLSFYEIRVDGVPIAFSVPLTIDSGEYIIVCRDFFSFEETFGDASGIWGDDSSEHGRLVQPSGSFSLSNSAGSVSAVRITPFAADSLSWTLSGGDGISWERENYVSPTPRQSLDPSGSTPGYINSRMPVPVDLSIDTVAVFPTETGSRVIAVVTNRGQQSSENDSLRVFYVNAADTSDISDLIELIAIPSLDTGFSTPITFDLAPAAMYDTIGLRLPLDSRVNNNRRDVMVVGPAFPPVMLSEFLANPAAGQTAEWIELTTRMDALHDIAGWSIGDALSVHVISADEFIITPGQYPVLTDNSAAFLLDYPDFDGTVVMPDGWATLNNSDDVVRLVDPFGFVADSVTYGSTYADNHTWARGYGQDGQLLWGRSSVAGGSPGDSNDIRITPNAPGLRVSIDPQVISPDGDGIDETAVIRVAGPADVVYTIRLYDRQGREVRTFEDGARDLRPEYEWDGRSGGGARLPIGIYILYVEAEGVESVKKTVVVAR